jgi:transmembrane sensor
MTEPQKEQIRPVSDAAVWFEKITSGDVSDQDMEAFEHWLSDPANEADYAECAQIWSAAAVPEFWVSDEPDITAQEPVQRLRPRFRPAYWVAAAAMLFIMAGVSLYLTTVPGGQVYQTAVGEQRLIVLADDSTVFLNTDSSIEVRYSEGVRRLDLERGEALFDVRRNSERPFEVVTEAGAVRVLGTKFAVRNFGQGEVALTVSEGRVAVDPKAGKQALAPVGAGEMIRFDAAGETRVREQVNADALLQWRDGVVSFSGEPLANVIEEIRRYTTRPIRFKGDNLADLKVSGIFRIGEVDSFLRGLAEVFPISVNTNEDKEILITAS